jgi:D-erythro-7,8-dihydroneopterin triphosphate epimerase
MEMDRILITDLSVRCIIGINDDERRQKQDVVINLIFFTDLSVAGKTDRIEDTVDYSSIKKRIYLIVEKSRYYLVEALAETIAAICLEYPAIAQVIVRVEKPSALRFAKSVGVEITRSRKDERG